MLSPRLVPTRLLEPSRRDPIIIADVVRPTRMRLVRLTAALLRYLAAIAWLRVTGDLTGAVAGRLLRETFERLGGLWIKAGQLLSLRIDLFPQAFCQELAGLQNRAVGFPTAIARQIVEEDLGAPISQYFSEFGERPFAVASIGQVYRARLRQEDVWVAVKVQKPFVAEMFARDLVFIRALVSLLQVVRFRPHMRWDLGYGELRDVMKEELDFHYEASSVRRMRQSLKGHKIYVPDLFSRYCTRRVLVTEFIHAILMADYIKIAHTDPARLETWLHENNVDPRKVARRLIHSIFRQILENNLYHGDLHPGNIVLLRNSRIALIDFGTTNFTEREYLQKFTLFIRALATRDYAKAGDLCMLLTASLPNIDTEEVKEQLVRVLRSWATRTLVRELPYHDKSLDNATIEVVKILVAHRCTMEWAWLRIHRALTTLDTSLIYLYPRVNYTRMLQRYFAKAEARRLRATLTPALARRSLGSYVTAMDIQDRINEYTLFQGTLVRRHAQVFRGATNKVAAVFSTIVDLLWAGVAVAGALGLLALLHQRARVAAAQWVGPQLSRALDVVPALDPAAWVVLWAAYAYVVWILLRLRRRLREKDVRPHERVASV
ncbi:MAG TPA: AarF/UbiB family protein [Gemmatimonadaceae bacterium]|nr:AarF/UbiB family protein [Vicinamibacterales bacterium]